MQGGLRFRRSVQLDNRPRHRVGRAAAQTLNRLGWLGLSTTVEQMFTVVLNATE